MNASIVIAPAMVATTVMISVSRLPTCAISWAMTPASSSRVSMWRMPVVTATAAFCGLRPVAKALGEGSSISYTLGIGMFASRACSGHQLVQLGVLISGYRPGVRHAERDLVAEPIGAKIHRQRENQRDNQASLPAQGSADEQQKPGENHQEEERLDVIHGLLSSKPT